MPPLQDRIQSDLNAARKSQDKARTLLLGTVLSEIKNRQLELQRDLTDDDIIEILRRGVKRRRESLDAFSKAGRTELAGVEREQIAMCETYLPASVDPEEIRRAVRDAIAGGANNIGAVMGKVMPQFKGRAEGNTINAIVREELSRKA